MFGDKGPNMLLDDGGDLTLSFMKNSNIFFQIFMEFQKNYNWSSSSL